MREGGGRDAQINRQRKKRREEDKERGGRERETVKEANRIRMGECEWESLA